MGRSLDEIWNEINVNNQKADEALEAEDYASALKYSNIAVAGCKEIGEMSDEYLEIKKKFMCALTYQIHFRCLLYSGKVHEAKDAIEEAELIIDETSADIEDFIADLDEDQYKQEELDGFLDDFWQIMSTRAYTKAMYGKYFLGLDQPDYAMTCFTEMLEVAEMADEYFDNEESKELIGVAQELLHDTEMRLKNEQQKSESSDSFSKYDDLLESMLDEEMAGNPEQRMKNMKSAQEIMDYLDEVWFKTCVTDDFDTLRCAAMSAQGVSIEKQKAGAFSYEEEARLLVKAIMLEIYTHFVNREKEEVIDIFEKKIKRDSEHLFQGTPVYGDYLLAERYYYGSLEDKCKSFEAIVKAWKAFAQEFGDTSKKALFAMRRIGKDILYNSNRSKDALPFLEDCYKEILKAFGQDSFIAFDAGEDLALALNDEERYRESVKIMEPIYQTMLSGEKKWMPNEVFSKGRALVLCYALNEQWSEAEALLNNLIEKYEGKIDKADPAWEEVDELLQYITANEE